MDEVIRTITGVSSITEDSNSSREETNNNKSGIKTKEASKTCKKTRETRANRVNSRFKETFKDFKGINPR